MSQDYLSMEEVEGLLHGALTAPTPMTLERAVAHIRGMLDKTKERRAELAATRATLEQVLDVLGMVDRDDQ